MYLQHNEANDLVINTRELKRRYDLIDYIKRHFIYFGYDEIYTSTFEHYDLYAKMNGSVNQNEMIKTIDNNGNVLVLRPDITIPITQQLASNNRYLQKDIRYFYVQDVFRQAENTKDYVENTQAGIEFFGLDTAEEDAEIITIATTLLKKLRANYFKIEIGHASFFQTLMEDLHIPNEALLSLTQYIQAKNVAEIENLLNELDIDQQTKETIITLPFLYGKPCEVLDKVKQMPLTKNVQQYVERLEKTYNILRANQLEDHLIFDMSLINKMDYYTGIIFQGFIENVAHPVLMGGRYNSLSKYFQANIPAVGFASNVDDILQGIDWYDENQKILLILFDENKREEAFQMAKKLRSYDYKTITYENSITKTRLPENTIHIYMTEKHYYIDLDHEKIPFQTIQGILHRIKERT